MTQVRLVSIFLVVQHSPVSLQVTVELGIMVTLGIITSSKPMDSEPVRMVESATLVLTVTAGLLLLTLLPALITSTSAQVLLALSTSATVLTVSLSVRLPAPDNLYTTEILMQQKYSIIKKTNKLNFYLGYFKRNKIFRIINNVLGNSILKEYFLFGKNYEREII